MSALQAARGVEIDHIYPHHARPPPPNHTQKIQYGSIIQLRKRGDDTKWVAELLAYGPECDLAVLTVRDERFWEGLHPIEFGELPALLDDVSVVRLAWPCMLSCVGGLLDE